MSLLDSNYLKWLSSRLWNKGDQLYADDTKEREISRVGFQISITKEIRIVKRKYKGIPVFLLYIHKTEFPLIPTKYYYNTLDQIDGEYFALSDLISLSKLSS